MSHSTDALVETLICPQCSASLEWAPDRLGLICRACPLTYPVSDGVPVLTIDHASPRPTETDSDFERLVAQALAAPFSGCDWAWLTGWRTTESWRMTWRPSTPSVRRSLSQTPRPCWTSAPAVASNWPSTPPRHVALLVEVRRSNEDATCRLGLRSAAEFDRPRQLSSV
jgi:uncharacterized protein YbaR (Trm112 family)